MYKMCMICIKKQNMYRMPFDKYIKFNNFSNIT